MRPDAVEEHGRNAERERDGSAERKPPPETGVVVDVTTLRERETERQRDRETERQRDRETERQRDRETRNVNRCKGTRLVRKPK